MAFEEPLNEREEIHNERVKRLEEDYPKLVAMIGDILMRALNGDIDEGRRLLGEFTIDKSGVGLPMRNFAFAKMFAEILWERDESKIIELIRNP